LNYGPALIFQPIFGNMMVHYEFIDIMATFGCKLQYMILIVAAPCKWEKTPNPQRPATHHFLVVVHQKPILDLVENNWILEKMIDGDAERWMERERER
jgi:hypothetical protein